MPAVETLGDAITPTLVEESKRGEFGSIEVYSARVAERLGPDDEPYIHVEVSVSDPREGADTWPTEDAFKLRTRVHDLAVENEFDLTKVVVVDLYPLHDDDEGSADPA